MIGQLKKVGGKFFGRQSLLCFILESLLVRPPEQPVPGSLPGDLQGAPEAPPGQTPKMDCLCVTHQLPWVAPWAAPIVPLGQNLRTECPCVATGLPPGLSLKVPPGQP